MESDVMENHGQLRLKPEIKLKTNNPALGICFLYQAMDITRLLKLYKCMCFATYYLFEGDR